MNDVFKDPLDGASREDIQQALFADLVMRQTNLVLMFLGKANDPQTGQPTVDLETAQMFIDQMEMLEAKTRGNLSKHEEKFLRDSLMHLRMEFVQATERAPASSPPPVAQSAGAPAPPTPAAASEAIAPASSVSALPEDEPKVKFTKKY